MTGKEAGHAHPPDPESLEVAQGWSHEKLEGWVPSLASDAEVREALEKAFDYRGDITITRKDGSKVEFSDKPGAEEKSSTTKLVATAPSK